VSVSQAVGVQAGGPGKRSVACLSVRSVAAVAVSRCQ